MYGPGYGCAVRPHVDVQRSPQIAVRLMTVRLCCGAVATAVRYVLCLHGYGYGYGLRGCVRGCVRLCATAPCTALRFPCTALATIRGYVPALRLRGYVPGLRPRVRLLCE